LLSPEISSTASKSIMRHRDSVVYSQVSYSIDPQEINQSITVAQPASISEKADYAYIMLSFIAKTLLAWLILSPVIMNA
jgi:hypothetical protein